LPPADFDALLSEERRKPMSKRVEVSKILFAMELAQITNHIIPWVDYMARTMQSELHLIHVIPRLDYYAVPYASDPMLGDNQEELLRKGRDKVDELCEEHLQTDPAKLHVVIGDPVEEILRVIDSENISLVVMGTQGRRGLDRALFGSVADRVLRLSPVPVFCVTPRSIEE
jgi:nucleotide-binding universal stress UspA family protein